MAGISDQCRIVGVAPTNPAQTIPTAEQSPLTTIKPLMPDTQNVFQHEPGPWAATRGGVTRTQVVKSGITTGATTTLFTVSANKSLFIADCVLSCNAVVGDDAFLAVYNAAGTLQYYLALHYPSSTAGLAVSRSFNMPILLPSGYILKYYLPTTGGCAGFSGWEE